MCLCCAKDDTAAQKQQQAPPPQQQQESTSCCFCCATTKTTQQQHTEQPTPCCGANFPTQAKWVRTHRPQILSLLLTLTIVGVGLIAFGISLILGGKKTTYYGALQDRQALYDRQDVPDFNLITVTSPAGFSRVSSTFNYMVIEKSGATTPRTLSSTYFTGTVPVASAVAGKLTVAFSTMMVTSITGTSQTINSTFSSEAISVQPNATSFLSVMGSVFTRTARNGPLSIGSKSSTFYPFTATSNLYSSSLVPSVTVRLMSESDPYLYMQELSKGTGAFKDDDVILIDPVTPQVFGAGGAIIAVSILLMILLGCCCTPIPGDFDPEHGTTTGTYAAGGV